MYRYVQTYVSIYQYAYVSIYIYIYIYIFIYTHARVVCPHRFPRYVDRIRCMHTHKLNAPTPADTQNTQFEPHTHAHTLTHTVACLHTFTQTQSYYIAVKLRAALLAASFCSSSIQILGVRVSACWYVCMCVYVSVSVFVCVCE
jgi:hypothetical protein